MLEELAPEPNLHLSATCTFGALEAMALVMPEHGSKKRLGSGSPKAPTISEVSTTHLCSRQAALLFT